MKAALRLGVVSCAYFAATANGWVQVVSIPRMMSVSRSLGIVVHSRAIGDEEVEVGGWMLGGDEGG